MRATLDADLDDRGSIEGELREEGAEPISFTGWLGLVRALTELADRPDDGSTAPAIDLIDRGRAEASEARG